jgi:parvulin-like peptidyl-prolyl isomerase
MSEDFNAEQEGGGNKKEFNSNPQIGNIRSPIGSASPISGAKVRSLNGQKFFLGALVGFLIILFLSLVVFGVGIYRLGWSGKAVQKITKILPYPAAFVNWRVISFYDYQDDIITLQKFFAQQEFGGDTGSAPTDSELKESVMDRLIKNEVARQIAEKYKIIVTDADLEAEIDSIIAQSESREKVEETLMSQYGWGIDQFKAKILEPFILQRKLQESIAKDEEINEEIKKKAEEVLVEINKGEKSFEELAKQYGEDGTAADGGDLGYFGKGAMVAEFEQAAFALEKGGISGLVQTKYGYHIIKAEDQIKNEAGEVTQVRARHILIQIKSLDDVLNDELGRAKIWRLIKI